MTKKITPRCKGLSIQLLLIADEQMQEACRIMTIIGKWEGSATNGIMSTRYLTAKWDNAQGKMVYRIYRNGKEKWLPIEKCGISLDEICESADYLLRQAYKFQKEANNSGI